MGMSQTHEALDRIKQEDAFLYEFFMNYMLQAAKGMLSEQEFYADIEKNKIYWMKTKEISDDVDTVIKNIVLLSKVQ